MAYQMTMASYPKATQDDLLRRYLESKVPKDEKIEALKAALASLEMAADVEPKQQPVRYVFEEKVEPKPQPVRYMLLDTDDVLWTRRDTYDMVAEWLAHPIVRRDKRYVYVGSNVYGRWTPGDRTERLERHHLESYGSHFRPRRGPGFIYVTTAKKNEDVRNDPYHKHVDI